MVERDFAKGHFFLILNCALCENSYHCTCICEKILFYWYLALENQKSEQYVQGDLY